MLIGYGILTWGGGERQSDRYGSVVLNNENFNCDARVEAFVDEAVVRQLDTKRVRLTAKVMEARKSGHLGDVGLGINPSTPEVGEAIELGVGILGVGESWEPGLTQFELEPEDGREVFWIDPRILYRLHDQTVELYGEETADPCHEAPKLKQAAPGVIATGVKDEGGVILQTKGVKLEDVDRIEATVENLGGGMFMVKPPDLSRGARPNFTRKPKG